MPSVRWNRLTVLALAVAFVGHSATAVLAQSNSLKIVVIAGEDAVNVIQQKTAVAPIVEVRDRNNLPIAGATVVFTINGTGATFGTSQALTVVTNAAGQATATGLTPSAAGAFRISARATFQGQTATATIAQSNVMTAAEAAKAANTGAASGGGMSAGKIIAIVGGIGAAGAGIAVAAGGSKSDSSSASSTTTPTSTTTAPTTSPTNATPVTTTPTAPTTPTPTPVSNNAPVITSASITPNVAMIGLDTPIALQVQASDADNDPLTYLWEFPDGSRSDQKAFTRTFQLGGTWNIRVTASDGKTPTTSQLTLEMKTMAGVWGVYYFGEPNPRAELDLRQTGNAITGQFLNSGTPAIGCSMTGTVRPASPQVSMIRSCIPITQPTIDLYFTLNFGSDINTLTGTSRLDGDSRETAVVLRRTR
jgi:hypothetical protein